jgi:copper chaperone CopZ
MITKISISGIHCDSCGELIKEIGLDQPGVRSVQVDAAKSCGEIEHDEKFDFDAYAAEVKANGGYVMTKAV